MVARLPGPESLSALPSGRSGRPIATIDLTAVGEGMADMGRGLQQAGSNFMGMAERRRATADQEAEYETRRRWIEFQSQEGRLLTDAQNAAEPGAFGFGKAYQDGFVAREQEFLNGVPATLRPQFETRLAQAKAGWRVDIDNFVAERRSKFYGSDLATNLDNLSKTIFADPDKRDSIYEEGLGLIRAAPDDAINPAAKAELEKGWAAQADEWRARGDLARDPAAFLASAPKTIARTDPRLATGPRRKGGGDMSGPGFGGFDATAPRVMNDLMRDFDLTPEQAAGIVGNLAHESGNFQHAQEISPIGGGRGGLGWAQWTGPRRKAFEAFARKHGLSTNSYEANYRFMTEGEPEEWEKALAVVKGPRTAEGVAVAFEQTYERAGVKAYGKRKELAQAALAAAGGDVVATHDGAASSAADPTAFFERYPNLPADKALELYEKAQREYKASLAAEAGELKDAAEDYVAFLRSGNAPQDDPRFSLPEMQRVLGPDAAQILDEELQRAQAYGADVAATKWASPDEIAGIVEQRRAALDSPEDFTENAQDLKGLTDVIKARNEALLDDPAAYVQQDPGIRSAYETMTEAMGGPLGDPRAQVIASAEYARNALAMQAQLGVPTEGQRILPKGLAAEIARQFKTQPEGGQNAAQMMRSLEAQWGKHWPQVFGELSGELPGTALVVGAMNRPGQERAAEQLAEAAAIGTQELEKVLDSDTKTAVKDGVAATLADFGSTVLLQPGGARTYTTFSEGVYQLALSYAVQGDSADRAASRAYEDVLGKAYSMQGTYRVPIEWDAGQVSMGAGAALEAIEGGVKIPPSLGKVDLPNREAAYLSALKSQGYWVTSPDESGLDLYDGQNYVVRREDGSPYHLTWQELVKVSIGDVERYLNNLPRTPMSIPVGEGNSRSPFEQTLESITE